MTNQPWANGVQSRAEQRDLKRMAILRQAATMFNQNGYHQTTLDDLATALNVTKPSLYYYVKNKDDILTGILAIAMQKLRQSIAAPSTPMSGYERLRQWFIAYANIMTDDFGACLILTRISALDGKFRALYRLASREMFDAVQQMVRDGIADQSIAPCDPKYAASALLSAVNEAVYWYLIDRKESPADSAEKFLAIFEQGLVPTSPSTDTPME